ncbi:hypothetical protein E4V42_19470 [Clostridium estertheticum]|uniref:MurNAc-LAA domain-containing protein n=1 Tax=Clostridium estertheticum TaxID=238834 RepID=A0A5N7ITH6_9CLOT|nr:N-acetylmuramoyl-L-alanine amidase [Clostridium estertheticum]MPQ33594.1 hypothetical protein [Clostridium estertheticum]MPQ64252.1 hypothetical protein [Clostridium estertheticum]
MKNILKAFVIIIITFIVCIPMKTIAKASTVTNMEAKKDVAVNKTWTVNFNKDLDATTVNTTNIKVLSDDNNYMEIKASLASNNQSLVVKPVKDYEHNKTYTLIVKDQVKSSDGKFLPSEVRMDFTTVNLALVNKYKIVLDAGHGGDDSGAIGPTGVYESTVNLAITLKVGTILNKNGVDTVYTRTTNDIPYSDDETKNLQYRCDISNAAKPNYFVCIHANAFDIEAANGTETYYYGGSAAGEKLAQAVQTEIIKATGKVDRGIKVPNYYVLNHTNAAAILIETLFITNPTEESLLASNSYQDLLAKAIATGILKTLGITNITY